MPQSPPLLFAALTANRQQLTAFSFFVVDVTLGVVLDRLRDQGRQACAVLDQLVLYETQLGAVADAERPAERTAQ